MTVRSFVMQALVTFAVVALVSAVGRRAPAIGQLVAGEPLI